MARAKNWKQPFVSFDTLLINARFHDHNIIRRNAIGLVRKYGTHTYSESGFPLCRPYCILAMLLPPTQGIEQFPPQKKDWIHEWKLWDPTVHLRVYGARRRPRTKVRGRESLRWRWHHRYHGHGLCNLDQKFVVKIGSEFSMNQLTILKIRKTSTYVGMFEILRMLSKKHWQTLLTNDFQDYC